MAEERMQTGRGVKPVIASARLPKMTDTPPKPTLVGGKSLLMAARPKADTGKTKRMPAVRKAAVRQPRSRPDMEAPKARATARAKDGYVRLRVRVTEGGRLTVVGAKAVEGELVEPKLQGAMAYEAAVGGKRIAAGGIPDVGEQRSFPDPKAKLPEMKGHHVVELPSYEVNVRVPKAAVKASQLPKLELALFRIKEDLPEEATVLAAAAPEAPLAAQFGKELREVARLKGIKPDKLAKPVADQLRKAFK
ncbi:MAG TPA: hypothetical protein VD769_12325 [Gaiellaceae bacterium]|nr:hypothetical protein [Gaiellaceae bacterium]